MIWPKELLVVLMSSDNEVKTVLVAQLFPEGDVPARREVCDNDLPVGSGVIQALVDPLLLFLPSVTEPSRACFNTSQAQVSTGGVLLDVSITADVVLRVSRGGLCHEVVRVQEEVVHREAWISDDLPPVLCRKDPTISDAPCVGDKLIPSSVEAVATVVVISEDTQPRFPLQTSSDVDVLVRPLELTSRNDLVGRCDATLQVDATPIKVVSDVEEVVRSPMLGSDAHLGRDPQLSHVVDAVHELSLVALVRRHRSTGTQNPSPIADDLDIVRTRLPEADIRQVDAIVVRGQSWSLGGSESIGAILTVRSYTGFFVPCVDLVLLGLFLLVFLGLFVVLLLVFVFAFLLFVFLYLFFHEFGSGHCSCGCHGERTDRDLWRRGVHNLYVVDEIILVSSLSLQHVFFLLPCCSEDCGGRRSRRC
mmetsp:Transcript_11807/g.25602  ORF Transcript_11807/g.25602 Transcript_11807/m.25602 type:complete len:420 (+) Transcript_11807:648-1907(+)